MSNSRTELSLLDLPLEIIQQSMFKMVDVDDYHSIQTMRRMATLSVICKTTYQIFQPELDSRGVKRLLIYILRWNKNSENVVIEMVKKNPKLFFIKSTSIDYAMDLQGKQRIIKDWSPYQAILGTGNINLLLNVKPYLDAYLNKLPNGFQLASSQEQEKFPYGFDFPPCKEKFNQLINELEVAITNDQQLKQNWKNASPVTFDLLLKFRNYRKPGIVQIGHHYNMNNFIKAHEIYDNNFENKTWNKNQLTFFVVFIIGFEERLMTAPYLDAICTGLNDHLNKWWGLKSNFQVKNYIKNKMQTIVPFERENLTYRLGEDFAIDSYDGVVYMKSWKPKRSFLDMGLCGSWIDGTHLRFCIQRLCQENTANFLKLMYTPKKQITLKNR